MARDAFEYDVGGELRDRYGRPQYVLTTKHAAPLSVDTSRAYQPTDADGRLQIALLDSAGNDLSRSMVTNKWLEINVLDPKYGAKGDGVTDDTAAIQSAIDAATIIAGNFGKAAVRLPGGYGFLTGQLLAKSGVALLCDGATIIPNLSGIPTSSGLVFWAGTGILTDFDILGGYWKGTGSETANQLLFHTGNNRGLQDCSFSGMRIDNWGVAPLYMRNPTRVSANFNKMRNPGVGAASGYNAINFVFDGGAAASGRVSAIGNIIDGSYAAAIACVNINNSGPAAVEFTATGNILTGISTGTDLSGSIDIELDGTSAFNWTNFVIQGNHIINPRAIGTAHGIVLGQLSMAGSIGRAIVQGNTVDCSVSATGVGVEAWTNTDIDLLGNRITAPTPISAVNGFKSGNRYSTGAVSGRATLVGGTVTVNTAEVQASDNILLTRISAAANPGAPYVSAITAGTSFTITSTNAADTGSVYWRIDH